MSVVRIYMTHSLTLGNSKTTSQLLEGLPPSMHQRALRYRRKEDAYSFIAGRLLLQRGLEYQGIDDSIEHIQIEESGKPFLKSAYFNISHSDERVVCAITETGKIGIDIEKEKEVELVNFKPWFTAMEWKDIVESQTSLQQFYRYWTRKESIIKALGWTLSQLHQIHLDIKQDVFHENGKTWYIQNLDIGSDYWGAICSEVKLDSPVPVTYLAL